jgi:hypothetical protein
MQLSPYRLPDEPRPAPALPRASRGDPPAFRPAEIGLALGIVAAVDLAFWTHDRLTPGGFGLGLALLAIPVAMVVATWIRRRWGTWRAPRLIAVTVMLGAVAIRAIVAPTAFVAVLGFALVGAFAMALRVRRLFVPDVLVSATSAVSRVPSRVRALVRGATAVAGRSRFERSSILPVVVPIALLAMFLGVFALANPLVASGLATVGSVHSRIALVPGPFRVLGWLLSLGAAVWLLRPTCRLPRGSEEAAPSVSASTTALLVARNALVAQNVLFFAYNALDARYLWSGAPPAGMTTQAYAHAGAFWLTLALVLVTAVIGVMFKGPLAVDERGKPARLLAYAWMAQGLVLAFGTYRRIGIHIARSGLSDLRIVGILGTTLVVCGVFLVATKLSRRRTFSWLLRRQLDAFVITAVFYVVAPTHLVSARVNVARLSHGEYGPLLHVFRQSHETESAAALIPLVESPDPRVRRGVAALLLDEDRRLRDEVDRRGSWREGDVATPEALGALDAARPSCEAALAGTDPGQARSELFDLARADAP